VNFDGTPGDQCLARFAMVVDTASCQQWDRLRYLQGLSLLTVFLFPRHWAVLHCYTTSTQPDSHGHRLQFLCTPEIFQMLDAAAPISFLRRREMCCQYTQDIATVAPSSTHQDTLASAHPAWVLLNTPRTRDNTRDKQEMSKIFGCSTSNEHFLRGRASRK
jgi:hypothetical protein